MEAAEQSFKVIQESRNKDNEYHATMNRLTKDGKIRSQKAIEKLISESTYIRPSRGTNSKHNLVENI